MSNALNAGAVLGCENNATCVCTIHPSGELNKSNYPPDKCDTINQGVSSGHSEADHVTASSASDELNYLPRNEDSGLHYKEPEFFHVSYRIETSAPFDCSVGGGWLILVSVFAYPLDRQATVEALREGGYILYFRHAATDWSNRDRLESETDISSCDPRQMRQLSEAGRESARAVGEAIRRLKIPVGTVYSSEYCRCVETAKLLDLGPVETTRDILNARAAQYVGGREVLAKSARRRLSTLPPAGSNTVLVAHGNVFVLVADIRPPEGGAAIVRPHGEGKFEFVGIMTARDWVELADE